MTTQNYSKLDSIIKLLRLWDLSITDSGDNFNWEARNSSTCPREAGEESCSHPEELSFQDFLNSNPADFSPYCNLAENPDGDPAEEEPISSLIGLASDIQAIEALDEKSDLRAFEDVANYPVGEFGRFPGLAKNYAGTLSELIEEKILGQFGKFPERFREMFDMAISQHQTWDIPALDLEHDLLVYAYTKSPQVSASHYLRSGFDRLLKHFYTQVSPGLFILPEPLLRSRSTIKEDHFENVWIRRFLKDDPDITEFYTLGGRPLEGVMPVEDSDDDVMRETLAVFANEMPFEDAVKAARII